MKRKKKNNFRYLWKKIVVVLCVVSEVNLFSLKHEDKMETDEMNKKNKTHLFVKN